MPTSKPTTNFEQALEELEKLIEEMEQGELNLEASLQHFEKGINLTRRCQQALQKAELKVQKLAEKNSKFDLQPFEAEE